MTPQTLSILLVEDNPVDARVQTARLTKRLGANTRVTHADTAAAAADHLAHGQFDVVLLDLNLPVSTGVETVARVRRAHDHVAIVAITGLEDEQTAIAALQCGAQDYLVKASFDSDVLDRTIRYAIERARASRERVAVEAQLQQAMKLEALGQLAAGIAHEINTPIQFIGDNCRFAEDSLADLEPWFASIGALVDGARAIPDLASAVAAVDEVAAKADVPYLVTELPKAMRQAQEGVRRVATIVRAMKQFCHPGDAERRQAQLNDALESAITISRNEWKHAAQVDCAFDPELSPIWCQLGELNQVFLNLIVNAGHAIAERQRTDSNVAGKIVVRTRNDGDHVVVEVADNGAGIPEAIRHKICTPFFTTKEPGKGTGQGLAIAHSIVASHGGRLWFESTVGVGTTFLVRLPIGAPAPEAAAPSAPNASVPITRS